MGILSRIAVLIAPIAVVAASPAHSVVVSAEYAYMIDTSTNSVLLDKRADVPMAPASMSKLMTVYMIFDALKRGALKMEDELPISRKAARKGGSKMFLRPGDKARVEDLLRGIIVQSGNDACIVVAETLGGSEEGFAALMTERAKTLGLDRSTFANATGWPDPNHLMSARDLARIAQILIDGFPDLYPMFRERSFTYSGIKQRNRNPLLYDDPTADGLKTGSTTASGYGLAASSVRDGRRIILVLNGLKDSKSRREEAARLMEWGFRAHSAYTLFERGEEVQRAGVWFGTRQDVGIVIPEDVRVTLAPASFAKMKVTTRTVEPVAAPVKTGDPVGAVTVSIPGQAVREIPLLAGGDVERLGMMARLGAKIRYLVFGSP